jgi:hypothetical protein
MIPPWRPHLLQHGQIILDTPIIDDPAVLDLDQMHRDEGYRLTGPLDRAELVVIQHS